MNLFFSTELAVPLFQIIILMLFSTLALLFGKVRLALIINYLFTFYWAYIFNQDNLMGLGIDRFDRYKLIYFYLVYVSYCLRCSGFYFKKIIEYGYHWKIIYWLTVSRNYSNQIPHILCVFCS